LLLVAACGGGSADDGTGSGSDPGSACTAIPADESGSGTYYDADGTGNCGFDATPNDLMVAAMNHADYGTADWCGACLDVTGPSGTVTVRVVDQCPGCAHGDLDLSPQAFQVLAPLAQGRIPITWHEVACDVGGPIDYHFKDGANAFWTAIQIRNHRYPIARLQALVNGDFIDVPRLDYNYFVQDSGLGTGPYTLRVTDTRGQMLDDNGVALGDNITRSGAAQFPVCP
jgi:expansin